jgi:hypothetical protein
MAAAQLAQFGIFTEPVFDAPRRAPVADPPALVASAAIAENVAAAPIAPPVAPAPRAEPPKRPVVEATATARGATSLVSFGERMLLPDFHGLTESEVRQITAQTSLDVKMTGHGRAVAQEPPAGTILARQQALVFIHFERSELGDGEGEG